MSLSIGIVGLPNVGKSTLFNALTEQQVVAANYPFATIEPNTGVVPVRDPRLDTLASLLQSDRVVPATVTFTDIAGLVADAHRGEGLGNQFLGHVREADVICQVIRVFADDNIPHVHNRVHPQQDLTTINTELMLADLQSIIKQMEKLEPKVKSEPALQPRLRLLQDIKSALDRGELLSSQREEWEERVLQLDDDTLKGAVKNLLTYKPFIYVFNVDEATLQDADKQRELRELVAPAPAVCICAKLEADLADLNPEEAKTLLAEYNQSQSGLEQLIQVGYRTLGLQTFFTAGEKETRAWPITEGATAPEAAGVVHTDFARGFIAAEVISYQDLIDVGSYAAARSSGKLRTEGREYVVQDGDVITFKFNV